MNKFKGFTLIELVITIAIVIILSSISAPLYKNHVKNAKVTEAYALLGAIRDAQLLYRAEYRTFLYCRNSSAGNSEATCNDEVLGVNARANKYYTWFNVGHSANASSFTAWVQSPTYYTMRLIYSLTNGSTYL
ncbi:MAG: pilin [Elusimicrobia bacterium]|nr:pilin [Elusimicrobiota bacterium]